jgi:arsenate reductase (glutaredoxin)
VLQELGVPHEVVLYLKEPPTKEELAEIVAGLEGPVEDLVRKDARFAKLGLSEADYVGDPAAVVDLLAREKALLQRPLLVRGGRAVIGRPKSVVAEFVASS